MARVLAAAMRYIATHGCIWPKCRRKARLYIQHDCSCIRKPPERGPYCASHAGKIVHSALRLGQTVSVRDVRTGRTETFHPGED